MLVDLPSPLSWDCIVYTFKAWNIPWNGWGVTDSSAITRSFLDFCCLFRRIFPALLNKYLLWMLSMTVLLMLPKCWHLCSVNGWWGAPSALGAGVDCTVWGEPQSIRMNSSFQLSGHFCHWEDVEVELVKCRCEGYIKPLSPGSVSSDVKQSSKISHLSQPKCGLGVCLCKVVLHFSNPASLVSLCGAARIEE